MKFLSLPEVRCSNDHLQGFVFWSLIFSHKHISLPQFCEECLLEETIGL